MARERSPQRDEAMKMWLDSSGNMKLKDIAAALGLGETQIRKWKSVDRWADALNSNVTNESNSNVTKRRGAPKGNRNAVGNSGGAPKGNQNAMGNRGGNGGPYRNKKALKHGMYETIFMDALDPDEQELLNHIDTTPLVQLEEQLRMLTLQERRHMKRVKLLEQGLSDEERKVKEELMQRKDMVPYVSPKSGKQIQVPVQTEGLKVTEITTVVTSKLDKILKQEEALVKTRDKKLRVINSIANLKQEEEKLAIARERLELDKIKALGYGEGEEDNDDEDDDGDDLGW
ncbi:phage terminase small subunit-related protein [Paenibacillus alvei]|uniref:Phage terminase small subunit-related protein n=1 Tax=Paenibacillus alvei TaxID=44250 RepID=A0ABT4GWZ7_PAEAL|nr:phage terminase small subunit-related protein [Paenibacillus alvei]MCY9734643.1 phage terminase small subunit-related protein [Paenibacillus alvei]MCY9755339.1 phage terminase small subunit-related protein [Paenibacillus alvei]MCY9761231.1 phage terminase small subunit-related protein [Paenibacillus alvei]MCY9765724.1 phage terminase small subunit-related protein [Paenibacillus alvei]